MNKKILLVTTIAVVSLISCKTEMTNPLLTESPYKYGAPAFDKITEDNYMPAFTEAIKEGKKEIETIVNNNEEPTFANTILALEYAGSKIGDISGIFYNLNEANTSAKMQEIAEQISPLMTEYSL
ncbi:MAG: M3 family peptidase, partial [Bacteroidales bacterium]